jgi:segregation and condensation protein A
LTATPVSPVSESRITGYQLRLPNFEGPLDVLLRLIERNQLEITEVSLVEVTDQFLTYVADLPHTSPDVLAEFTSIASRLLVLKSRSLLPSEPVQDEEDIGEDLTSQLIAYKAVKDAAELLKERQDSGYSAYGRPPVAFSKEERVETLLAMPASMLVRAFRRCINRQAPEPARFTPRPVISLAEMTGRIIRRLRQQRRMRFSSLLSHSPDRHEQVAGFVALLTLWKQRAVELWQPERFADIEIESIAAQMPDYVEQTADD